MYLDPDPDFWLTRIRNTASGKPLRYATSFYHPPCGVALYLRLNPLPEDFTPAAYHFNLASCSKVIKVEIQTLVAGTSGSLDA